MSGTMTLMPPAPDKCQECASAHEPHEPHNAQSLYYQVAFQMKFNRAPSWIDATAHCAPEIKALWRRELMARGVDFDGGGINPQKSKKVKRK